MKNKLIKFLLVFIICVNFTNTVLANNLNFADDRGILLYEEKSGTVLYEQNGDKKFFPASTTKIMTALLVLENLEIGDKITIGDEITLISEDSSKADLQQGEVLTVEELLYGLLLPSGNDVAYTLAKNVGSKIGGVTDSAEAINYFIEMMNQRAKELGASNTHFVNPHGLHNEDHYSTPNDMLIITKELLKHDEVKKIISTPIFKTESNLISHEWVNTNVFLHKNWDVIPNVVSKGQNQYYAPEVTGIKTGFTNKAGRCVVFSAQKDGLDLIGLIFHSNYEEIWQEGIQLMDFAAENYDYVDLVKEDMELDVLDVLNPSDASPSNISVIAKENIPLLVKTENMEDIYETKTIEYDEKLVQVNEDKTVKLKKDIKTDEIIGKVSYSLDGKVIVESDVYFATDVDKRGYLDFLFHWQILVLFMVLLFLLMARIIRVKKKIKRRRIQMRRKIK